MPSSPPASNPRSLAGHNICHNSVALLLLAVALLSCCMRPAMATGQQLPFSNLHGHLATKAPYAQRVRIKGAPSLYEHPDPPGYKPIFLWLLARHGSRWPTGKRMRQINGLEQVFKDWAPLVKSPQHAEWMQDWTSPTAHMHYMAGELHATGDAEMMGLAERLRERFPGLSNGPYAPRRNPLISTQVPRAAQSASAFSLGFFGRWVHQQQKRPPPSAAYKAQPSSSDATHHTTSSTTTTSSTNSSSTNSNNNSSSSTNDSHMLGHSSWLPQPVAVSMLPRLADPVLRFFETCKAYREHEDVTRRWLSPWMHQQIQQHIIPGLAQRLGLNPDDPSTLNPCHVEALWQLCAFEATAAAADGGSDGGDTFAGSSSSNSRNGNASRQAVCELFTAADVALLEWLDDVRLYETQGYGATVNYAIAAPLLSDLASALTAAASAHAQGKLLQLTRLHFAHCETLTPLATLMGLFADEQQQQQQQQQRVEGRQEAGRVQQQQQQQQQQQRQRLQPVPVGGVPIDPVLHVDELSDVEEEVREDLPVLEAAESIAAAAAAAAGGGGVSSSGAAAALPDASTAQVAAAAAAAAAAVGRHQNKRPWAHQHQQHQQQQQQQDIAEHFELKRRRKLQQQQHSSAASSSSNAENISGGGVSGPSSSSSSSKGDIQQQQQQQQHTQHHQHEHGPGVEGCSFSGKSSILAPSHDWLRPPDGWQPAFAADDAERAWRGGRVASLGANMVLVLYARDTAATAHAAADAAAETVGAAAVPKSGGSSGGSSGGASSSGLFRDVLVRLVYNEQVIRVPGCGPVNPDSGGLGGYDCTLDDFLKFVVGDKTASERFSRYCYGGGLEGLGGSSSSSAAAVDGSSSSSSGAADGDSSSSRHGSSSSNSSSGHMAQDAQHVVTADGLKRVLSGDHWRQQQPPLSTHEE